jgi:hypothetical protein
METRMKLTCLLGLALLVAACDENPSTPPLGSVGITSAAAPSIAQELATSDGWTVKYTQFLVSISAINVAGNDRVLAASSSATLINLVPPDAQTLLSSNNRIARAWENVNFEIGPVTADTAIYGAATQEDLDLMLAGGFSIFVRATMTRGPETKTLAAGFTPDTKYDACTGTVNGVPTPGLLVPKNGIDTVAIGFTGDVLFFDNLVTRGHALRGDPIAKADANNDGTVDNAELSAVTLDALRSALVGAGQSLYEATPGTSDLNGFIGEQARSIVATFRDTGTCTPTAVTAAP